MARGAERGRRHKPGRPEVVAVCWQYATKCAQENGGGILTVTEVTRDELKRLETRVDIVESEVEGEKMISRYILEQSRRNADDLAAIKSCQDRHDQRFDNLERNFNGLERKVDTLIKDLPKIIAETMREVLRERDS